MNHLHRRIAILEAETPPARLYSAAEIDAMSDVDFEAAFLAGEIRSGLRHEAALALLP